MCQSMAQIKKSAFVDWLLFRLKGIDTSGFKNLKQALLAFKSNQSQVNRFSVKRLVNNHFHKILHD